MELFFWAVIQNLWEQGTHHLNCFRVKVGKDELPSLKASGFSYLCKSILTSL